ncbi:unnamed protein product [Rotaria sp. Silwood2]|nr:unnamed protein product [Rotaria sp. Silwood2]
MEFPFDINYILPYEITIFNGDYRVLNKGQTTRIFTSEKLTSVIDAMGEASYRAQGLSGAVTTTRKFRVSDHRLYIIKKTNENNNLSIVIGILKVGAKHLYIYDTNGTVYERTPLCVLDFYVHESKQRLGYGKRLFDTMLEFEKCAPYELAIDRPSNKCLAFLNKHYHLSAPIHQVNNFVVYPAFFNQSPIAINNTPSASKQHTESISWLSPTSERQQRRPFSEQIDFAELAVELPENWQKNLIDQALFERLHMTDPSSHLLISTTKKSTIRNDVNIIIETRCLHYLAGCYQRLLRQHDHFKLVFEDIRKLFIDHTKTAISLPDLYENQDLSKQWLELLIEGQENSLLYEYIDCVNNESLSQITDEIENLYNSVFRYMYKMIQPLDYFSTELIAYVGALKQLAKWPALVRIIFRLSHPKTASNRSMQIHFGSSGGGRAFEDTLVGSFLSKSCLPSLPGKPYLFFEKPKVMTEHDVDLTAKTMWQVRLTNIIHFTL